MLMLINNIFLTCALIYVFFQGNSLLDRGVAKGKITPEQAASRKRWLRPTSAVGAICMLVAVILELTKK
ncbi:MAG TPA: hypothetical protein VHG71_08260 [Verrucomicrobiae bacterium]|nr:hypothetical protein [Verrucomicrobiae bacterium]